MSRNALRASCQRSAFSIQLLNQRRRKPACPSCGMKSSRRAKKQEDSNTKAHCAFQMWGMLQLAQASGTSLKRAQPKFHDMGSGTFPVLNVRAGRKRVRYQDRRRRIASPARARQQVSTWRLKSPQHLSSSQFPLRTDTPGRPKECEVAAPSNFRHSTPGTSGNRADKVAVGVVQSTPRGDYRVLQIFRKCCISSCDLFAGVCRLSVCAGGSANRRRPE